jgi:hypothetical protein
MANQFIPVVTIAHEVYLSAIANGATRAKALDLARRFAGSHCLARGGAHRFSDDEIRLGVCDCEGCRASRSLPERPAP